ncbi:hypothetical protein G3M54_05085 [Bacillus megaterium NBRC 15308 = ATCC 14581]|nr:hypothetical protein [Priestia megaterium NBRC 15308 = ATCC 14581]
MLLIAQNEVAAAKQEEQKRLSRSSIWKIGQTQSRVLFIYQTKRIKR